ncbi:MAG: xanthine dehydrogenase family protein subunit M [Gammaproteobacteria bacterium]|nr:xanthine dehydrogenase family protein subunit M [Gammaproteobacteria bacterium]
MLYESPQSIDDAVSLLKQSRGSVHILAGGSDLLVRMKSGFVEPDVVVDIKRIKSLQTIKKAPEGFVIGAAVSCAQLRDHKALVKAWPGVVEAANLIGSDQIQNRCTMVGNLCNASPAADSVPALVAANAMARVRGVSGTREVPVEKIVKGPGTISLKKAEMVEALVLPLRPTKSGDAYLRLTPRTEMDIAVVSAAVSLELGKQGVVTDAEVALGAVAPTVVRVKQASKLLIGSKLDDDVLDRLAELCQQMCNPIDDKRGTVAYRTRVSGVLAKRAAINAYERAGGKR